MKILKISCISIGIVLLMTALSLIVFNLHENKSVEEHTTEILSAVNRQITDNSLIEKKSENTDKAVQEDLFADYRDKQISEKIVMIDGVGYIGTIAIPQIEIELPVMSEYSYEALKKSPCRYKGNYLTGDMIIAAHNYKSHFGKIKDLDVNSEIIFTDMDGNQHEYEVSSIEEIRGTDVEKMCKGSAEEWDLTLFTCTLDGRNRVTVRADERVKNET